MSDDTDRGIATPVIRERAAREITRIASDYTTEDIHRRSLRTEIRVLLEIELERVVRECADMADDHDVSAEGFSVGWKILTHYGLEKHNG